MRPIDDARIGSSESTHEGATMHISCNKKGIAMSDATFTFRVDIVLKTEFSAAAKANDTTGAQLLRDFMRDYVEQQQKTEEYDAWLSAKVERSRASAETGNLESASEVDSKFAARRATARRRLDAAK